jgi:hypothetical protein
VAPEQTRYRSRGQTWSLVGFGVFFALLYGSQASRSAVAPDPATKASLIVLGLLLGAVCVWVGARPVLICDADGVTVRNLFRTHRYGWSQIRAFRIGRYKRLRAVAIIDLSDGSSMHAFAIQVPNVPLRGAIARESRMIVALNARLATTGADPGT